MENVSETKALLDVEHRVCELTVQVNSVEKCGVVHTECTEKPEKQDLRGSLLL